MTELERAAEGSLGGRPRARTPAARVSRAGPPPAPGAAFARSCQRCGAPIRSRRSATYCGGRCRAASSRAKRQTALLAMLAAVEEAVADLALALARRRDDGD